MNNLSLKLRLIFLPFVLLLLLFPIGYSGLLWLLTDYWQWLTLDIMVINFWGPMALGGLAVLVLLRPRFKLLVPNKKDSWGTFFGGIALFALVGPTFSALDYLRTSTGKLTHLRSVAELPQHPSTRYYVFDHYYISKRMAVAHPSATVAGKNNETLNFDLYVSCPVLRAAADTAQGRPAAWVGVTFHRKVSNRLTDQEKEQQYQDFLRQSHQDFLRRDLSRFQYLERVDNDQAGRGYRAAVAAGPWPPLEANPTILRLVDEPFATRSRSAGRWYLILLGLGASVFLLALLFPTVDTLRAADFQAGAKAPAAEDDWLQALLPRRHYFATPLLINANLAVFLLMVLKGLGVVQFQGADLLAWGANYGPAVRAGQWWRLLTSAFVHDGLMHLANNLVALGLAGWVLEKSIGTSRLLLGYALGAVGAGLASLWWYPATVSVGASGAIFALYGFGLTLIFRPGVAAELRGTFLLLNGLFMLISLVLGFLLPGVDNAGHLGGLLTGGLTGLLLFPWLRQRLSTFDL